MNWLELSADELIRACATPQMSGAWEEFMRRYHSVIKAAATRVCRHRGTGNPEEIDDVIQEIYLKLYEDRVRVFSGFESVQQDAIFGFVKIVATNAARDFFRHKAAARRGDGRTERLEELTTEVGLPPDIERRLALRELYGILVANTQNDTGQRDRAIFQCYYRDGMTAKAISELPGLGLNLKGVEGVLHRLKKTIRAALENTQEMGAS